MRLYVYRSTHSVTPASPSPVPRRRSAPRRRDRFRAPGTTPEIAAVAHRDSPGRCTAPLVSVRRAMPPAGALSRPGRWSPTHRRKPLRRMDIPRTRRTAPDPVSECRPVTLRPCGAVIVKHARYAVGLRGPRQVHLVADDAIQGQLDDRTVVHTLCGRLGWGPLDTAPHGWPVHPACASLAHPE